MFISFEGIDGSGKSTQLELLAQRLRSAGRTVVTVRDPGGTPLGEAIRSLLLDDRQTIDSRAELLLFCAARAQLVHDVICPALGQNAVVLADRFIDSTTAYQIGARGVGAPGGTEALHRFATNGLMPDRTILLDLSPEAAQARRAHETQDRLEQEAGEFFQRVGAAYRELAQAYPSRIVTLDATLPSSVLEEHVWSAVGPL